MRQSSLTVPIEERCFEDYAVGSIHEYGSITVTQDEIIAFAERFDPQTFHTDPEGAKRTVFGGIIASGWHTCGIAMRIFVDNFAPRASNLSSPGIDELRWPRPVRPGDDLSIRITVLGARPSRSKPDRGVLVFFVEVLNQRREIVMTMKVLSIMLRRVPG